MTASTEPLPVWARTSTALRALSAMPLIQSGMSLVMSSVVSSALGFLFWILAARNYSSSEIGIGSAVITAMILLSDVSHLGLRTGLVRFVPIAGADTERLVVRAYGTAMAVAGSGAIVFVAGLGWWVPELELLRQSFLFGGMFVAATMFWVVFQLEDSVLLGLRLAPWVPVENGVFGLVKIGLLFPLAGLTGRAAELGVFMAWSLPVFIIVIVVTASLARVMRRQRLREQVAGAAGANGSGPLALGSVMRYSLVDWTATVSRSAVIGVLPILVLQAEGSSVSAYFAIAWTIAYSVHMLSANVSDALLAEASYDKVNVDRHTLHSGLLSLAISAPVVIVAVIGAPWVLRAFGQEYSDGATGVLRLLLLSSIPNIVTRTYVGRLRADARMKAVFVFEALLSAGVLILGWVLLRAMGIVGVGLAWLLVLTLAAIWVVAVQSMGWWAPRLDPSWLQRLNSARLTSGRFRQRFSNPALDRTAEEVMATRYATVPDWKRLRSSDHSQTIRVSGHEGRPPLLMEIASTPWGAEILTRRKQAIIAMGDLAGLPSFRALVPFPIEHHTGSGFGYLIESAVSGTPGDLAARQSGASSAPLVGAVNAAMDELHAASSGWLTFDADELDRWVAQPLRTLGDRAEVTSDVLLALRRRISDSLDGRCVPSARIHGNLTLDKARFDQAGRLTGLVDWEWSTEGPVFLDWSCLALSAMAVEAGHEVGMVVNRLLEEPTTFTAHHALADRSLPDMDPGVMALFAWLHTLAPVLRSAPATGPRRLWTSGNVDPVAARFTDAEQVQS